MIPMRCGDKPMDLIHRLRRFPFPVRVEGAKGASLHPSPDGGAHKLAFRQSQRKIGSAGEHKFALFERSEFSKFMRIHALPLPDSDDFPRRRDGRRWASPSSRKATIRMTKSGRQTCCHPLVTLPRASPFSSYAFFFCLKYKSTATAASNTRPLTTRWISTDQPRSDIPLFSTPMISAPTTAPVTVPAPPATAVPPI